MRYAGAVGRCVWGGEVKDETNIVRHNSIRQDYEDEDEDYEYLSNSATNFQPFSSKR